LATGQATRRWDNARIVVQSIRSGERTTVLEGGSDARYLPTGHLVYAVGGTLFAVRFDVARLATLGNRVPVVEGVRRSSGLVTGAAHYAVSDTGNLIYVPGPRSALANSLDLGLANEAGDVQMLKLPPAGYQTPRVSPDGKRVAFGTDDGNEAVVYTYELSGASRPQRLTAGGNNRFPVWTPDSKRIAFQSDRAGTPAIWWQPADGTGEPAALTTPAAGEAHIPAAWSPTTAGRLLFSSTKNSQSSLWVYSLEDRKAEPFAGVESTNPIGAVFSPDGQWIAYSITTEGKPTTTYVQPDRPGAARFELFARPGDAPHEVAWSPDGSKLYYNPAPQRFEAVTVTRTPAFAFGNPVVITKEFILGPASAWRNYDVTPDGKFIGVYAVGESGSAVMGQEIQVVLNWFEELKARVR
jgi:DNA-binding beta-propeller fold protein YncE